MSDLWCPRCGRQACPNCYGALCDCGVLLYDHDADHCPPRPDEPDDAAGRDGAR